MLDVRERDGAIIFMVRVVPRAARSSIEGEYDGALKVRVCAPPVEGAANEELARCLARAFDVPARAVQILSGQTAKLKRVSITGASRVQLERLAIGK